jgi:trimeric autotransporter adhesin
MKKIYFLLIISSTLSFVFSTSFSQTITLGNLGTTSFCENGTLSVPFSTDLLAGTVYKVYLSNSSGSFTSQTEIGNGMSSPIVVTFPQYYNLIPSSSYKIRIVSVSPSVISNTSPNLTTNTQRMTFSVKSLANREIYGESICENSALTGFISSNQTGLTYEWKKNGILQSNNSSFQMVQTGNFDVSIQKIGCTILSRTISMTFTSPVYHFPIRNGEQYQCAGGRILYQDSYYSDYATYQWKKDGNVLIGRTKDTLIANQTGVYKTDVVDNCPVVDYESSNYSYSPVRASVFFSNTINNGPVETTNNLDGIICGNSVTTSFYSRYLNSNTLSPYTYQWKKNGINITNATNSSITGINQAGIYSLEIKQGNCSVHSIGKEVIKKDTIKLNLQVNAPYSKDICQGLSTYMSYYNYLGVNYTLYKNGIASPYVAQVNQTANYVLTGTASGCTVLPSDTLRINVGNNMKIYINNYRQNVCIDNGNVGDIGVTTTFSGLPNVSYQWFRNNQYYAQSVGGLRPTQSGFYKLRISSGSCVGISDSTEVIFTNQLAKPSFKGSFPSIIPMCSNNLITFGINSGIANNLIQYDSLFLKRNGQIILKQDFYPPFTFTQSGIYTVIAKQRTCQTESDPVEIKIGEPITANITGTTSIYAGQKANLSLNFTGGNSWSYQTSDLPISQTTSLSPTIKSVSPTTSQTYTIMSVASNCGVGTVSGSATITVCQVGKTSTIQSGNWNVPSTWSCGQVPSPTIDTIIENGHTVTLPNGYQGVTKKLDLRGGLIQGFGAGVRVNQ